MVGSDSALIDTVDASEIRRENHQKDGAKAQRK